MAKNFSETVQEAQNGIPLLSPKEVNDRIQADPNTLVLDIRDAGDLNLTGIIEGSENVSMGTLFFKADHSMPAEYQAECLSNKDRHVTLHPWRSGFHRSQNPEGLRIHQRIHFGRWK